MTPNGLPRAVIFFHVTCSPATAIGGLMTLKQELDALPALRNYGLGKDSTADAADAILPSVPASNPRGVTAGDLRALLRAAWSGADHVTALEFG